MTITTTDLRTALYSDGLTGITGASVTETSFVAELASCAAEAYNIATGQIYFNTTLNTTTTGQEMLYVWSAVVATQNGFKEATIADSSHAQYVGDGTNNFIVYQAGNDRDVFKHADGQVSFQCFLVDMDYLSTANTNGDIGFLNGSFASLNEAAITRVGAHYTTLSKALGGGNNCYMDIIRYGGADQGIRATGGSTSGTAGNFAEICVQDRSTADGKAHGIIREYTTGSYGVQGTLHIGTITANTSSYFEDNGVAVSWEDRLVADDKYKLIIEGQTGTGTNSFILTNSTISSAGPAVTIEFDGGANTDGMDVLTVTGCTFLNTRGLITWSDALDAISHISSNNIFNNVATVNATDQITCGDVTQTNCSFIDCGQILLNGAGDLNGCTITRTNHPTSMVVIASVIPELSNCDFVGEATNKHALELVTIPAAITWDSTFDSNFASGSTGADVAGTSNGDEVIYFNPPAANSVNCTITVSAGAPTPSIRKGANYTGTVEVLAGLVTTTITVVDIDDQSPIEGANVYLTAAAGGPLTEGTVIIDASTVTNSSGVVTDTRSLVSDQPVTGRVRKATSLPYAEGAQAITNGTFDTNLSGWTINTSGSASYSWNTAQARGTGAGSAAIAQAFSVVQGQLYRVSGFAEVIFSAGIGLVSSNIDIRDGAGISANTIQAVGSVGRSSFGGASTSPSIDWVADRTGTVYLVGRHSISGSVTGYSVVDNLSVRPLSFQTLYKTAPIAGTIDSDSGLTVTVQMIKDE